MDHVLLEPNQVLYVPYLPDQYSLCVVDVKSDQYTDVYLGDDDWKRMREEVKSLVPIATSLGRMIHRLAHFPDPGKRWHLAVFNRHDKPVKVEYGCFNLDLPEFGG